MTLSANQEGGKTKIIKGPPHHFSLNFTFILRYYSTIKFMVSVAIFCTYYIQIFVFFYILEPIMMRRIHEKYHKYAIIVFRVSTVCFTCKLKFCNNLSILFAFWYVGLTVMAMAVSSIYRSTNSFAHKN